MEADFFEKVYEVVKCIPYGKVTSYGAIAKYLGAARSARMVGWALSNLKYSEGYIPAHRVLNRNGQLSGKAAFGSPTLMQELLENEGVKVIDDQVVGFKECFWDPFELDKEL